MKNISSRIIELEMSIKILEYLRKNNFINNSIYEDVLNSLLKKQDKEKNNNNFNIL